MIQERYWRYECDNDGNLCGDVDEVDSVPRKPGGKRVGYVTAATKELATALAKKAAEEWAQKHRLKREEDKQKVNVRMRSEGTCIQCCRRPLSTKNHCRECAKNNSRRQMDLRKGIVQPKTSHQPLPPEVLRGNILRSARESNRKKILHWGGRAIAYTLSCTLKKFDEIGASAFRAYLCQRIRALGGGAALDEYERERAKRDDLADAAE